MENNKLEKTCDEGMLECSRIMRAEWLQQRKWGEGKETDQTDNGFSKSRASCRGWKDSDAY